MDVLLVLYSLLFFCAMVFPFVFLIWKYRDPKTSLFGAGEREDLINLCEEKKLLLANLRDLKTDEETGKLTPEEFQTLSAGLLLELDQIDQRISEMQVREIPEDLSVCPICGTKRIEKARFCYNCGYQFS